MGRFSWAVAKTPLVPSVSFPCCRLELASADVVQTDSTDTLGRHVHLKYDRTDFRQSTSRKVMLLHPFIPHLGYQCFPLSAQVTLAAPIIQVRAGTLQITIDRPCTLVRTIP